MGKQISTGLHCVDEQAELSVLAAVTIHPERLYDIPFLKPEHFYIEKHREYFERLLKKAQEGEIGLEVMAPIINELGMSLTDLTDCYLGDETNTVALAENVIGLWKARKTQEIGIRLVSMMSELRDPREITNNIHLTAQSLAELAEDDMKESEGTEMADIVDDLDAYMLELQDRKGELSGVATGISKLDYLTTGLQPGQLIVIAGRPAMGKTAFALNIAAHAATDQKKRVGIFHMEQTKRGLTMRLYASHGLINMYNIRHGKILDNETAKKWMWAREEFRKTKMFIEDVETMGIMTPSRIRARCRKAIRKWGGLDLVVIDYLQLLQPDSKEDRKDLEIGSITRALKLMAMELNVPVIVVSQLSRAVEQRQDKRPLLSDLRESGAIEQDADVVLFPFRPEYYERKMETGEPEHAEIILAKQRDGAVGTVNVLYIGKYLLFTDGEPKRRY